MSHDADKLIRQLSLVAYLMAERRPITARDVKSNVEGYSEMSDEAFARRFYSDRAELQGLGVPLQSQRDEFTGEELYNLRSENYFLPELSLSDDEFAALQTSVYLLEGQFAYAEPLRLALQNLAAGRAGFEDALSPAAGRRVRMSDPDYSPEMAGRLAKLETAYSKGRTVRFEYWSISRDEQRERTVNPLALLNDGGAWYVVGEDLDDERRRKKFRVSRIRGDIRFATRRERDFRIPADFSIDDYRGKPAWQLGDATAARPASRVRGDTAWWIVRTLPNAGTVEDGVFETPYASVGAARLVGAAPERARDAARAGRAARRRGGGARARRRRPRGTPAPPAAESSRAADATAARSGRPGRSRPSASASCRRSSPTCSAPAATSARRSWTRATWPSASRSRSTSSRSTCRSSTSSTSAAAATRSTRSARRRGARGQGALQRGLPQAAASDARSRREPCGSRSSSWAR